MSIAKTAAMFLLLGTLCQLIISVLGQRWKPNPGGGKAERILSWGESFGWAALLTAAICGLVAVW
jgi:hypothetical protein